MNTSRIVDAQQDQIQRMKQQHANRCAEIYAAAQRLERTIKNTLLHDEEWTLIIEGEKSYWKNSGFPGKWRYEEDKTTRVTTFKYYGTDEEKKKGLVGTDGTIVLKKLDSSSYDYTKTEDFIARGLLSFDTLASDRFARYLIQAKKVPPEKIPIFQAWLLERRKKFEEEMRRQCKLDYDEMRNPNTEKKVKYFKDKCKLARELIQQNIVDLSQGLSDLVATNNKPPQPSWKEMIDLIELAEKYHIADRGRPIIIKVTATGKLAADENELQVFSAQFPQGTKTLPSSIRDGKDSEVKLSNHVLDIGGRIGAHGEFSPHTAMDNHSSYPPIEDKDEPHRRYVASLAVREKLAATARNMLAANPGLRNSGEEPITISLATMMLLSPIVDKKIEKLLRSKESEHDQLGDSRWALELISHLPQPMEIKNPDGSVMFVKVDLTYMNLPVNTGLLENTLIKDDLQTNINARGFNTFAKSMDTHILAFFSKPQPDVPAELGLLEKLQKQYLARLETDDFKRRANNLETSLTREKNRLDSLYNTLNSVLVEYHRTPENETLKKQYRELKDYIRETEDNINKLHIEIIDLRKENYKKHLPLLHQMKVYINTMLAQTNPPVSPDFREELLLQSRYISLQELFYTNNYMKAENAYFFHSYYLLANAQLGNHIESFCKSGEDRTGWLRIMLLTFQMFNEMHGRDPDFSNAIDRANFNEYSNAAHTASVSLENTAYNSDARGLQVEGIFTHQAIGMSIGKQLANLAKNVFDGLNSFEPTKAERLSDYLKREPSPAAVTGVERTSEQTRWMAGLFKFTPPRTGEKASAATKDSGVTQQDDSTQPVTPNKNNPQ